MSAPNSFSDPKEATEAKLCAFLEGELTQAERAEIEQHLAANPQHRQLLADLARTREWMRTIPAESSPVDLAEMFEGQAERSMLLDDPHAGESRWVTRWPQLAMLAAVVLLTVGLGVLVVAMLRGPKAGENKTFSLGPAVVPAATSPALHSVGGLASKSSDDDKEVMAATPGRSPAPVSPTPSQVPLAVSAVADAPVDRRSIDDALPSPMKTLELSDSEAADQIKARLLAAGYPLLTREKTVGFVISANSPNTSVEQVRGFFDRHQLAFDDVTAGKAAWIHSPIVLANNSPAATQPGAWGMVAEAISARKQQATQNGAQNGQLQTMESSSVFAGGNAMRFMDGAKSPTTAPTDQGLYVAYGLTPLQLELLAASLETDNPNQSVRRVTLSEGDSGAVSAAASPPPAGAIQKGQTLSVTVAQLVGPGIEKTNVVKVADDGTIALPMIDPIPAAGASPADLQQRIADKYREANLIPQATVTVVSAAPVSSPGTQPITTTEPTTLPSTQPVAATTQPAPLPDTGIAVVVLVETTK